MAAALSAGSRCTALQTGLPQLEVTDKTRKNWQPLPRTGFNEGSFSGDDGLRRGLEFVSLAVLD